MLRSGKRSYRMEAGDLKRLVVNLWMPTVAEPTPLAFTTRVIRSGVEVFKETHDYTVYPPLKLEAPKDLRLGIFDRTRKTPRFFKQQGVPFVEYSTVESVGGWDVMHDLKHLNCLLIGEGGFDAARLPRLRPAIDPYLEAGGVIICLRQDWGFKWLSAAKPLPRDALRQTTISWRRSPGHPILAGITDEMLRWWYGDNIVSNGDFIKEARPGWHAIVDSAGLLEGLNWASVVEMPVGKGAIVFCQMNLMSKLTDEPAALQMLQNLLAYAATRKPSEPGKIRALGPDDSKALARLRSLGVELSDNPNAHVIVVDADAEVDEAATTGLTAALAEGRTVLLHGLTPENLDRWKPLTPADLALTESTKGENEHAVSAGEHPLLAGISATDLWWGRYGIWGFAPEGGVEIAHAVKAGAPAREVVRDGGLLEVPVGSGRLLIDQLLWESTDVHQQRSAQYILLLLQNLASTKPEH